MILLNNINPFKAPFGNGETHVDGEAIFKDLAYGYDKAYIDFYYENDADFMKLMFIVKHIDSKVSEIHLTIRYMPYSRMDRVEGHSVFTLKTVAEFINDLLLTSVTIYEPHSDVTMALINDSKAIYPTKDKLDEVLNEIGFNKEKDVLFFPDAGAQKRYHDLKGFKQAVGFKKRNFQTNKIEGLEVLGEIPKGAKVLILDDLCSYGGTFMMAGEKLKELGAGEVSLFITHCEHNIFKGKIFKTDVIDNVFTTNTMMFQESIPELTMDEVLGRMNIIKL